MKEFALVVLFACVLTVPPLMTIAAAPAGDGPFVLIHPPWVDGGEAVVQAGGRQIGLSDTRITTLAAARDPAPFLARLRDDRVGFAVAVDRLPFLCAGQTSLAKAAVDRPAPPSSLRPVSRP